MGTRKHTDAAAVKLRMIDGGRQTWFTRSKHAEHGRAGVEHYFKLLGWCSDGHVDEELRSKGGEERGTA